MSFDPTRPLSFISGLPRRGKTFFALKAIEEAAGQGLVVFCDCEIGPSAAWPLSNEQELLAAQEGRQPLSPRWAPYIRPRPSALSERLSLSTIAVGY